MKKHAKKGVVLAVLLAVLQPAFGLEINNNTDLALTAAIKCKTSGKHALDIGPKQATGFEGDPSDACKYDIAANKGKLKCSGNINAASGLQVSAAAKKLVCQSY